MSTIDNVTVTFSGDEWKLFQEAFNQLREFSEEVRRDESESTISEIGDGYVSEAWLAFDLLRRVDLPDLADRFRETAENWTDLIAD